MTATVHALPFGQHAVTCQEYTEARHAYSDSPGLTAQITWHPDEGSIVHLPPTSIPAVDTTALDRFVDRAANTGVLLDEQNQRTWIDPSDAGLEPVNGALCMPQITDPAWKPAGAPLEFGTPLLCWSSYRNNTRSHGMWVLRLNGLWQVMGAPPNALWNDVAGFAGLVDLMSDPDTLVLEEALRDSARVQACSNAWKRAASAAALAARMTKQDHVPYTRVGKDLRAATPGNTQHASHRTCVYPLPLPHTEHVPAVVLEDSRRDMRDPLVTRMAGLGYHFVKAGTPERSWGLLLLFARDRALFPDTDEHLLAWAKETVHNVSRTGRKYTV